MSDIDEDVLLSCTVPKFHTPSCFWVLFDDDVPKRNAYNEKLNSPGVYYGRITDFDANDVGKRVILQHEEEWVRGEVAQVKKDSESKKEFLCWLLDYGIFVTTALIYKVPNNAFLQQPFVRKAMLYGMISSVKAIDYDGVTQVQAQLETEWSPGVVKFANNVINAHKELKFRKKCIYEDLVIGELFLQDAERCKSVGDLLVASQLAAFDEDIFLENLQFLKMTQKPMASVYIQTKFFSDQYFMESGMRSSGRGTFRFPKKEYKEKKPSTLPNTDLFCDAENDQPCSTQQEKPRKWVKNDEKRQEKSKVSPKNDTMSSSDKKKELVNLGSTGRGKKLKELLAKRRAGVLSGDESDSSKDDQNSIKSMGAKSDSSSSSGRGFRKLKEDTEEAIGGNGNNLYIPVKHDKRIRHVDDCKNFEDAENKLESPENNARNCSVENISVAGRGFSKSPKSVIGDNTSTENISVAGRGFSKSPRTVIGDNTSTENISGAGRGFSKSPRTEIGDNTFAENISCSGRGFSKSPRTEIGDNTATENISGAGRGFSKSPRTEIGDNTSTENISVTGRGFSKSPISTKNDKVLESIANSASADTSSQGRGKLRRSIGNKEVGINLFSDLVKSSPDKLLVTAFGSDITHSRNKDQIKFFDSPVSAKSSDSESLKSVGKSSKSSEAEIFSDANKDQIKPSGRGFEKVVSVGIGSENGRFTTIDESDEQIKSFGRGFGKGVSVEIGSENERFTTIDESDEQIKSFGRGFGKKSSKSDSGTDNITYPEEEVKSIGRSVKSSDTSEYETNNEPYKRHTSSSDQFDDADEVTEPSDTSSKKSSIFRDSKRTVDIPNNFHPAGATIKVSKPSDDPNFIATAYQNRPPQSDKDTAQLLKEFGKNFKSDENRKPNNEPEQKSIPGFCQCKDCVKWRTGDNVFEPSTSEAPKPQKPKFIMKPPLLFKTEGPVEKTYKIETKRVFDSHTDKLAAPRILVHGFLQASCTPDLPHTPFNEKIQNALKQLKYSTAYSIQTYTWPAILRGLSTFVVAVPESGKTMVYVPAICNSTFHKNEDLSTRVGPTTIILCPRVEIVENVYRLFTNILKKSRSDTTVYGLSHLQDRAFLAKMKKSVDILITTPRLFIKLLKDDIFSMERICHLVLEEAHDLFSLFSPELDYILKKTQKVLENRTECIQVQLIVISQEWTKPIEELSKKLQVPPLVCIGAHLEAALYGKAEIKIQFSTTQDKPAKLIKIVENIFHHRKTIIICNDSEDPKDLLQFLETNGILYKTLLYESTIEDINATKERWLVSRKGSFFALVCSDNIFNTGLAISDADVIIQYSLPENWSQFTFRFSGFLDSYSSPLVPKSADVQPCKMHIMIDETNTKQIPKMLQFLKRMGTKVTQSLSNLYDQLNLEVEKHKLENNVSICENLLCLGYCKTHISCKSRHLLDPVIDVSPDLPQSGIIKLKIIHVKSPMKYNARIIEYKDAEGVSHDYASNFEKIVTQLLALTDDCVQIPFNKLKVGSVYAVKETEGPSRGAFQRGQILEIISNGIRSIKKIRVRFIDMGYEQCIIPTNFYRLPNQLQKIPPQAVPIYIANIGPPDFDVSWPMRITVFIAKDLKDAGQINAESYFTGRIKLQLGNAIFVDDLKLQEVLDGDDFILQRLSVRDVISKYNALEKRPNHLKRLYKLCEKYKIPLQDYSLPLVQKVTKVESQVTPQWAHLENLQEFNTVFFALGHSPESFFVKLSKYSDCLEQLNKDIVETMNKPFYRQVITPVEGHCYLVRDPLEETYARAIITKLKETTAECFFVDYGDSTEVAINEIKFLPDELITKLPFQVIECELYGIGPANIEGSWLSETTDILYDVAYETGTDLFRFLYVKVMDEQKSAYTSYKKYSVILCDISEGKDVIINNLLMDMGYAFPTTEKTIEIDFEELKNRISNTQNGSSDDEIEQIDERQEPITDIDEDEWDLQLNNPEEFFKSLFKFSEVNGTKKTTSKIEKNNSQNVGTTLKALPMPSNGWSTPNVVWQQTNSHVTLKVQIPDVTKYEVKLLQGRMLSFKASRNETSYRLQLNLFAKVNQKFEHSTMGLYIMIKFEKLVEGEWERLILNKEKQRYITYNLATIPVDDDSDDEQPLPQNKIQSSKILGEQLSRDAENGPFVYEYGSDIDWNESDIESEDDSSEE